jgi:hypothetical protein
MLVKGENTLEALTWEQATPENAGLKGARLAMLRRKGYSVPNFICLPSNIVLPDSEPVFSDDDIRILLAEHFPEEKFFTVRASAQVEDDTEKSFDGPFAVYRRVIRDGVAAAVRSVLQSIYSETGLFYCTAHRIRPNELRMAVLILPTVEFQSSGLVFTRNPKGIENESVIIAGVTERTGVVTDSLPATMFYHNVDDDLTYYVTQAALPGLSFHQAKRLLTIATQVQTLLDSHIDLEYSTFDEDIVITQVRPMKGPEKPPVVLRRSLAEKYYPGVILPLHASIVTLGFASSLTGILEKARTGTDKEGSMELLHSLAVCCNGRLYFDPFAFAEVISGTPLESRVAKNYERLFGMAYPAPDDSSSNRGVYPILKTSFLKKMIKRMDKIELVFRDLFNPTQELDPLLTLFQSLYADLPEIWETLFLYEVKCITRPVGEKKSLLSKFTEKREEKMRLVLNSKRKNLLNMLLELLDAVGAHLKSAGYLDIDSDVQYLTLGEVRSFREQRHRLGLLAEQRKSRYTLFGKLPDFSTLAFTNAPFDMTLPEGNHVEILLEQPFDEPVSK